MAPWERWDDTAGPGTRFRKSLNSPFIVKKGQLVEFRVNQTIRHLLSSEYHPYEKQILLAGFHAWVICPKRIIKGKNRSVTPTDHLTFISDAMALRATEIFSFLLGMSRYAQRTAKKNDWSAKTLLGHPSMQRFPYEVFFSLGGFQMVLKADSIGAFRKNVENQRAVVRNVIALMKILHFQQAERPSDSRKKKWGLNKAKTLAAELLEDELGENETPSEDSIDDHWRNLKPAAPYIYAASLIENGLFLKCLFADDEDDEFEGLDNRLPEWLAIANEVARQILQPLKMLEDWQPLDDLVAERPALPALSLDARWATYLRGLLSGDKNIKLQPKPEQT